MLTLNFAELTCYILIALGLRKQNKTMDGKLNKNVIQNRNRGSALTLSGQVISFFVEILLSIMLILAVKVSMVYMISK